MRVMLGLEVAQAQMSWVSSFAASRFSAESNFFALASAISQENPLPISFIYFRADHSGADIVLRWQVVPDQDVRLFEVQESSDNRNYYTIHSVDAVNNLWNYQYHLRERNAGKKYYRIRASGNNEKKYWFSKTIATTSSGGNQNQFKYFRIYNSSGQLIKTQLNSIDLIDLPSGIYFISEWERGVRVATRKIIKNN